MRFNFVKPSGLLAQFIRYYWVLEADEGEGKVTERVIPIDSVQLMFHYRKPFVVKQSDSTHKVQPKSIISGLSNSFFDVSTQGSAGVIAVLFHPWGACNFFNFNLYELENSSIDLTSILNKEIRSVQEQICNETSLDDRVRVIESFLLKNLSPIANHNLDLLYRTIGIINESSGNIRISDLSNKIALTPKSLERKFSAFIGKTPKQFIRLVRFQCIVENFRNHRFNDYAEFAYNYGYYDHSHFINDFKTFTGYTPKDFQICYFTDQHEFNSTH